MIYIQWFWRVELAGAEIVRHEANRGTPYDLFAFNNFFWDGEIHMRPIEYPYDLFAFNNFFGTGEFTWAS
jgi:hypothetical protein